MKSKMRSMSLTECDDRFCSAERVSFGLVSSLGCTFRELFDITSLVKPKFLG